MASRRPSSRPSPRRRSSASEGARTTREIQRGKVSTSAGAAAQAAKEDEASARKKDKAGKADRKKAARTTGEKSSDRARRDERARRRDSKRTPRENAPVLSIGGLDVSTRLVVVMVVAAILSVMLVPSLYQWWQQERELAQIKAQVAEQQKKNADMQRQLDLWSDPDYISTQARERLGYVRPGETQYTVVDPGPQYQDSAMAAAAAPTGPRGPGCNRSLSLWGRRTSRPPRTPSHRPRRASPARQTPPAKKAENEPR